MTSKVFIAALFLLMFYPVNKAQAFCVNVEHETNSSFEAFIKCENTFNQPKYTIYNHYFDESFVGIFTFDPRGANIICTNYELVGKNIRNQCLKAGVRDISSHYKNRNNEIELLNISSVSTEEIQSIFDYSEVYKFPDFYEEVAVENCFVSVTSQKKIIFGYDEDRFMDLSNCLRELEGFVRENHKFMLKN